MSRIFGWFRSKPDEKTKKNEKRSRSRSRDQEEDEKRTKKTKKPRRRRRSPSPSLLQPGQVDVGPDPIPIPVRSNSSPPPLSEGEKVRLEGLFKTDKGPCLVRAGHSDGPLSVDWYESKAADGRRRLVVISRPWSKIVFKKLEAWFKRWERELGAVDLVLDRATLEFEWFPDNPELFRADELPLTEPSRIFEKKTLSDLTADKKDSSSSMFVMINQQSQSSGDEYASPAASVKYEIKMDDRVLFESIRHTSRQWLHQGTWELKPEPLSGGLSFVAMGTGFAILSLTDVRAAVANAPTRLDEAWVDMTHKTICLRWMEQRPSSGGGEQELYVLAPSMRRRPPAISAGHAGHHVFAAKFSQKHEARLVKA